MTRTRINYRNIMEYWESTRGRKHHRRRDRIKIPWKGFGKGRQYTKHMNHLNIKLSFLVPSIISRALNVPNRQMAAKTVWTSSSRPSLLLGATSIVYTDEIIQRMNSQQARLRKWILGLNKSASATITLGMMGPMPLEEEITHIKVKWWRKTLLMPENCWPRQIFKFMKGNVNWDWYQ